MMFPTYNTVTNFDGFYVSYNAYDYNIYGCDTTALVVGQMQKFYILDGDQRELLISKIKEGGLDGCVNFIKENRHLLNQFRRNID